MIVTSCDNDRTVTFYQKLQKISIFGLSYFSILIRKQLEIQLIAKRIKSKLRDVSKSSWLHYQVKTRK